MNLIQVVLLTGRFLTSVFLLGLTSSGVGGCGGNDLAGVGAVGEEPDALLPSVLDTIAASRLVPALGVRALAATVDSGVVSRDAVVFGLRVQGLADRVQGNDLWHVGSLTKAMTATLAARLVEQGILDWGTTVAAVFPDFVGVICPEYEDVRLDELMYHTSRLPVDVTTTPSWPTLRTDPAPITEQRRRWSAELLSLEPVGIRGEHRYTNAGYVIAGAMMEELTGQSWEELMRIEVFDPLGMNSAGFGPPGTVGSPPDQPRGHTISNNTTVVPQEPNVNADNPAAFGPAGTVHVSLEDYGKFLAEHLEGLRDSSDYLSAQSWEKLHTAAPETSYALGWGVDQRTWARGRTLAHSGSNSLWFAVAWIAPERNMAFVAVTNVGAPIGGQDGDGFVNGERATDQAIQALILRAGFSF